MSLSDILSLAAILFWGLVPLFWIPVHFFSGFYRKIGIFTYITPLVTWGPFVWLVLRHREALIAYRSEVPAAVQGFGILVFLSGLFLQLWTLKLLRVWGIMGLPEVTTLVKGRVITQGPFGVVRHPTYLSHTIMFAGIFLMTGVFAVGIITLVDIVVINTMVIPLEDRELIARFGNEYSSYREKVPAFFPRAIRK